MSSSELWVEEDVEIGRLTSISPLMLNVGSKRNSWIRLNAPIDEAQIGIAARTVMAGFVTRVIIARDENDCAVFSESEC